MKSYHGFSFLSILLSGVLPSHTKKKPTAKSFFSELWAVERIVLVIRGHWAEQAQWLSQQVQLWSHWKCQGQSERVSPVSTSQTKEPELGYADRMPEIPSVPSFLLMYSAWIQSETRLCSNFSKHSSLPSYLVSLQYWESMGPRCSSQGSFIIKCSWCFFRTLQIVISWVIVFPQIKVKIFLCLILTIDTYRNKGLQEKKRKSKAEPSGISNHGVQLSPN